MHYWKHENSLVKSHINALKQEEKAYLTVDMEFIFIRRLFIDNVVQNDIIKELFISKVINNMDQVSNFKTNKSIVK